MKNLITKIKAGLVVLTLAGAITMLTAGLDNKKNLVDYASAGAFAVGGAGFILIDLTQKRNSGDYSSRKNWENYKS